VWVAAHDLSGGMPIAPTDVAIERLPTRDVPAGALAADASPVGRQLAAPMRRGEPMTNVRLMSPSLLAATSEPGALAVPVRVADGPAALALVHAGDTVDVIAVADSGGGPPSGATVVHDVRVLATPAPAGSQAPGGADSDELAGLLIVEANRHQATALAEAATSTQLSVAVQRPS
jgi:Flp pilus assembly protein CpaB